MTPVGESRRAVPWQRDGVNGPVGSGVDEEKANPRGSGDSNAGKSARER